MPVVGMACDGTIGPLTTPTVTGELWGVWITQDRKREGRLPRSYWWQGPEYKGDHVVSRAQAERAAEEMKIACPKWMYEARPYEKLPGERKRPKMLPSRDDRQPKGEKT